MTCTAMIFVYFRVQEYSKNLAAVTADLFAGTLYGFGIYMKDRSKRSISWIRATFGNMVDVLNKLTKKYIFSCKLKGKPVEFDSSVLYHKGILKLLSLTGVWEKDPIFTSILTSTYAFTILYQYG